MKRWQGKTACGAARRSRAAHALAALLAPGALVASLPLVSQTALAQTADSQMIVITRGNESASTALSNANAVFGAVASASPAPERAVIAQPGAQALTGPERTGFVPPSVVSPSAMSPRTASPSAMPRSAMPRPAMPPVVATAPAPTAAAASEQQDAAAIQRAASAFLRQQTNGLPGKVGITVVQPFPRGLADCTTLEPFMPPGARLWGNTTVGVRCVGAKPWTLYLQARVSVQGTYYSAGRMIKRGDTLTAADLVAREGDLTAMPQAIVTDPALAIGAVATALISAGLPLRQDLLRSASSIQAGQSVTVVAAGNGFSISAQGSALSSASAGQQLQVRTENGQIVTGIVKENGTVEVRL